MDGYVRLVVERPPDGETVWVDGKLYDVIDVDARLGGLAFDVYLAEVDEEKAGD
jgi:hypothetical protein